MTRIEQVARALPQDIHAAIVTGQFDRRYLTGVNSSAGVLIITRSTSSLIIDSRYHELAASTAQGCEVVLQDDQGLYKQIAGLLKKSGAEAVALESKTCNLKERNAYRKNFDGVTLIEDDRLGDIISRLRARKSSGEIENIRAAQNATDKAFEYILGFVKPGQSERKIAIELEVYGRKMGFDAAFSFIIAAGPTSSMPHAVPGDRKVQNGDILLFDFGFKAGGYCSDMTRTVAIGQASEQQLEVYDIVLRAQLAGIEKIKPGAIGKDVDAAAREIIDASPYKGLFGHGLGHALGLEIHEPPRLAPLWDDVLEPGMVLTVEPGIYLPGQFGVRIEDLIVVTEDGYENLTSSPKELIVL